jgi:2-hydroxychromene-2-carboxylate isomerase
MKQIDFYLDFISPYAYLAFEALPAALQGHSYTVRYKPILFAGLLGQYGQLGPAEIPPKRDWTYRQVLWQAQRLGVSMQMPAAHPFNPLGLLRLAVASSEQGLPNRYVIETLFRHVWQGGHDAANPDRLKALTEQLAPPRDPHSEPVKADLKHWGDEALALQLFGVPSLVVDGKVFWGYDSLPMLADYLADNAWFQGPDWNAVSSLPYGLKRREFVKK